MNKKGIRNCLITIMLSFSLLILGMLPIWGAAIPIQATTSALTFGVSKSCCSCKYKCIDKQELECIICTQDISNCKGKELEVSARPCDLECMNMDCAVCVSDITITIMPPLGWKTKVADVSICFTDNTGLGIEKAEVKVERNGNWQDITEHLTQKEDSYYGTVEISENCTIYVAIKGKDNKVYEKSRYIECFDRTMPTLTASLNEKTLQIVAGDDLSGVSIIDINGEKYTYLNDGTLELQLKDLANNFLQFSIQAIDEAGNKSKTIQVENPNYKQPDNEKKNMNEGKNCSQYQESSQKLETNKTEIAINRQEPNYNRSSTSNLDSSLMASTNPPTLSQPINVQSEKITENKPHESIPLTPDGQGTIVDNVTEKEGKEFFTITTANENIFYLVIDRQKEHENVYFLNAVTESDLMALAEKDDKPKSIVPEPEPICNCTDRCQIGSVNKNCPICKLDFQQCKGKEVTIIETEEKTTNNTGGLLFIFVVALIGGIVGWYFKIYRPKQEFIDDDDQEDSELGVETINEDDVQSGQSEESYENEIAYYDDYPDDEEEEV